MGGEGLIYRAGCVVSASDVVRRGVSISILSLGDFSLSKLTRTVVIQSGSV